MPHTNSCRRDRDSLRLIYVESAQIGNVPRLADLPPSVQIDLLNVGQDCHPPMIAPLLRELTSRHRAWAMALLWLLVVTVLNVQTAGDYRSTILFAIPVALVSWIERPRMRVNTERVNAWLQPEQVHLDVPLLNSMQALQFIADAVGRVHQLDPAPIFRALSRREQAGSTGLGAGFAVPHARIPGIDRPLTCLVRARAPVEFKAPDHEPVSLMLAILVPEHGDRDDHLQLLGRVAELFSKPRFRARMDTDIDATTIERSFQAGISQLEASRSHVADRTRVQGANR